MSMRNLTCIGCPMGCALQAEIEEGVVTKVLGNTCKKGEDYAKKECTHPTRIVTSSAAVERGELDVVPVKTERDVPKEKIFDVIKEISKVKVKAPIEIEDVIIEDVAHTGVNVIATKKVDNKL